MSSGPQAAAPAVTIRLTVNAAAARRVLRDEWNIGERPLERSRLASRAAVARGQRCGGVRPGALVTAAGHPPGTPMACGEGDRRRPGKVGQRDVRAGGGRQRQRMSATQSGVTPISASSKAARAVAWTDDMGRNMNEHATEVKSDRGAEDPRGGNTGRGPGVGTHDEMCEARPAP
ncbi:hypothetical protein GCM10018772_28380 [Streptomyces fumanus]|uniref:Uncharacterized protein n=1 Tax=Streptomyces fumanus TaxID=67302 RepID=A0A919AF22_9ACTN|nr:hypothetical protein GCM10018772_28380 [Streptomyces fumanus]